MLLGRGGTSKIKRRTEIRYSIKSSNTSEYNGSIISGYLKNTEHLFSNKTSIMQLSAFWKKKRDASLKKEFF